MRMVWVKSKVSYFCFMTSSFAANFWMITSAGTGGGPGCGSEGMRFTSNLGGGAIGPVLSWARALMARSSNNAVGMVNENRVFIVCVFWFLDAVSVLQVQAFAPASLRRYHRRSGHEDSDANGSNCDRRIFSSGRRLRL